MHTPHTANNPAPSFFTQPQAAADADAADGGAAAQQLQQPLQDALAAYLARAEAHREDMGDRHATVEHLVLAMAEDPRFGEVLGCATGFGVSAAVRRRARVAWGA